MFGIRNYKSLLIAALVAIGGGVIARAQQGTGALSVKGYSGEATLIHSVMRAWTFTRPEFPSCFSDEGKSSPVSANPLMHGRTFGSQCEAESPVMPCVKQANSEGIHSSF